MREFTRIETAAGYALRNVKPAFVFDGPEGGFVVAIGRDARELIACGLKPLTLSETIKAAG